jgi:threonine dehydrogenase-like Zn-dependent dehydrogenase
MFDTTWVSNMRPGGGRGDERVRRGSNIAPVRAIAVTPGQAGSAQLIDVDEPKPQDGELLVEMLALGVCGTDREILSGEYGWAPDGAERMVLGHESLGRVRHAAPGSGLDQGDLVVGIVRRPDPVPCRCCAAGDFDMCRNGRYRERGIKELDGYGAELVTLEPGYAVRIEPSLGILGVLTEPASVVAKAWEQIEAFRGQSCRPLETVLVTGAGPVGLLAALMAVQRGYRVQLLDRATDGPKPELARGLGAGYHTGSVADACGDAKPDIVLECTGAPQLVVDAMQSTAPGAIVCLLGVSAPGQTVSVDMGALNNELVLENDIVFGSVNANRRHFQMASEALAGADPAWLEGLITRRVPLDSWADALDKRPDDIKAVIELSG